MMCLGLKVFPTSNLPNWKANTWTKRLPKRKEPSSKPYGLNMPYPNCTAWSEQGPQTLASWIQLAQMVLDGRYGQKWPYTVFQVPNACPICLTPIPQQEGTQCGHVFQKKCLLQHLDIRNTCPICRALLIDP
ncbi:hypothetical protein TNCV_788651 [Trichonephila clavipes]|nr:hypothetical protein TNCV_788651 [Trichonephila clavipes]